MDHSLPLITTLVGGFVLAYILGMLAQRLKISPMVGYLAAGVISGPFTPGYVADMKLVPELAELGVILLMFGVGLHFSFRDLMSVKRIAIPGAIAQIAVATLLGMGLSSLLGWDPVAGLMFGLALSTASTVVLLRALESRQNLETLQGRIAIGWLIVEDLVMVLALVILPIIADIQFGEQTLSWQNIALDLAWTLGKVSLFVALMMVVGSRFIPWLLAHTASTGSRELFTLAVLTCSLGIAFGAVKLFGVSFALGAFFTGIVMNRSELSHRAANNTLPLQDAFAVLFFVSVGMLFNPAVLLTEPLAVLATLFIIMFGKSAAAYAIVRLFRYSRRTALTISASLAQIGEFSFILIGLAIVLKLVPEGARDLILVGASLSIMLNPLVFNAVERYLEKHPDADNAKVLAECKCPAVEMKAHTILVGYGRVGRLLVNGLQQAGRELVVIEQDPHRLESLRQADIPHVNGNVADDEVLCRAAITDASWLLVAIPNSFEAGEAIAQAKLINPAIRVIARAHSDDEVSFLTKQGADKVIMGEREIALGMLAQATA
ncbi:YbaL family putative K(+) efflux transporter [Aeromonas hydrophila]|uniref:YbaL family putative K(+) efflux transporter n=1 Tax=Aeromonas hydrophila TaxID=644 RepID=UPI000955C901|nr:YbaL family putative K(+) efflux transporter [Aeromonas hydrophila]SIQ23373.1 Kef-type potassium/proton antiporter, CPA2 family [Aeromonas hydrophila]SIQ31188.1 Kef-type potassium/proton antiporter, CPA2 family [Aeromonas hydrophila]HDX8356854.1 Kef family K(+) transporter [Aeromonas hydrophila]